MLLRTASLTICSAIALNCFASSDDAQAGIYFDVDIHKWRDSYGVCHTCTPENGFPIPVIEDGFYFDPSDNKWHGPNSADICNTCTPENGFPTHPQNLQKTNRDLELSEDGGLNGINSTTPFTVQAIRQLLPSLDVKRSINECEFGLCESIIVAQGNEEIATISGENDRVSTIRVVSQKVTPMVEGKIGDKFDAFIFSISDKIYRKYCVAGLESDSGSVICKTRTASRDDTSHIRQVFSGEYQGPDGELPPLEVAKNFKIVSTIWHK
ncbi:MAG: DUF1131 family protein [Pseudomonadota bacterium]